MSDFSILFFPIDTVQNYEVVTQIFIKYVVTLISSFPVAGDLDNPGSSHPEKQILSRIYKRIFEYLQVK